MINTLSSLTVRGAIGATLILSGMSNALDEGRSDGEAQSSAVMVLIRKVMKSVSCSSENQNHEPSVFPLSFFSLLFASSRANTSVYPVDFRPVMCFLR